MRKTTFKSTHYRVVLSGNELEVYAYGKPVFYNFSSKSKPRGSEFTDTEENRNRSRGRARKMVRRLVDANFGMHIDPFGRPYISKFLPLTFDDEILLPEDGNPHFTLFIKRLNYQIFRSKASVIQYIAVIEFMPKSKRVHYHIVLFNLPYIDKEKYYRTFADSWDNGYVWIRKVPDKNVGRYISKYMTKADDEKLRKRKSYFCSRRLIKPLDIRDEKSITTFLADLPLDAQQYANAFESEYTGITEYKRFSLEKYPRLREMIVAQNYKPDTFKSIT